ncbi:MAG: hypothetical protein K0R44_3037 [Thermomicrobiales bacterium]|nr:hypothetical protein [Thermomicrobiales bacterium]
MANESLTTYLNDHLAGSVVALELLDHLAEDGAVTAEASTLAGVHADIEADRQELEAFMAQLGIIVSAPRKATGWLVEKLSEIKLHFDDAGDGALQRLGGGGCAGARRARLRASGTAGGDAACGGGIAGSPCRSGGVRLTILTGPLSAGQSPA